MTVVTVALGSSIDHPSTPSCVFWCNYPAAVNAGALYCCINSNHKFVENTSLATHPGNVQPIPSAHSHRSILS
ncbi:putative crustin-like antimicrobial peptide 5 [Homarus americanus]|uniref:Putative crustin-like antimicrobial peptide 5 n=2 Tax=Homarus americanus TaxID=6706 RepID=A0A8J5MU12_HOMAM|nr:putative crustin-like antimicrobial peptide 5 [Homarus americanus]